MAETLSDNIASIALLEKLGYQKQAVGIRVSSDENNSSVIDLSVFFPRATMNKSEQINVRILKNRGCYNGMVRRWNIWL